MIFLRKHRVLLALGIILLIGSYLRFVGIFDNAFAFTYDVGRDMLAVSDIVQNHNIPFIGPTTGLPGLFYGPWWYYFLVPAFIIGGGNPQFISGFIALTGLAAVVLGFFLGKKLSGDIFGLILAALLSFSPVMVALSVQIWNPNLAPFLLLLILTVLHYYMLYLKTEKKQAKMFPLNREHGVYGVLLGFLAGLSIDAEVVYGLLLLLSLYLFLIVLLWKRKLFAMVFVLIGTFLAFLPRILFEVKNNFIMTKTVLSGTGGEGTGPFTIISIEQIVKVFTALKTMWDETIALHNPALGWLLLAVIIVSVCTQYKKFTPEIRAYLHLAALTFIVFFLGLSFFTDAIWSHYLVGIPVFLIFLFALSMTSMLQEKRLQILMAAGLGMLLFLNVGPGNIWARYTQPPWVGDASVYRNQVAIIDYIYKEAAGEQFNSIVYTPPVHDYHTTTRINICSPGMERTGFTIRRVRPNSHYFSSLLSPTRDMNPGSVTG
jgi:hypothetical protein